MANINDRGAGVQVCGCKRLWVRGNKIFLFLRSGNEATHPLEECKCPNGRRSVLTLGLL